MSLDTLATSGPAESITTARSEQKTHFRFSRLSGASVARVRTPPIPAGRHQPNREERGPRWLGPRSRAFSG